MFEIDFKPRRVILQEHRRFKVGKDQWEWRWEDVRHYNSASPFNETELMGMITSYIYNHFKNENISNTQFGARIDSSSVNAVRFVTTKGNQLMSDKSIDFLKILERVDLCIGCFRKNKDAVAEQYCFAKSNPAFISFEKLQEFIMSHRGIKNVRAYPVTETDNYTDCYLVTFNDGTEMTASMWRSMSESRIPAQYCY